MDFQQYLRFGIQHMLSVKWKCQTAGSRRDCTAHIPVWDEARSCQSQQPQPNLPGNGSRGDRQSLLCSRDWWPAGNWCCKTHSFLWAFSHTYHLPYPVDNIQRHQAYPTPRSVLCCFIRQDEKEFSIELHLTGTFILLKLTKLLILFFSGWCRTDFSWTEYLAHCRAMAAPETCFDLVCLWAIL